MSDLRQSVSEPPLSPTNNRPAIARTQSAFTTRRNEQRIFYGTHLDDNISTYHTDEHHRTPPNDQATDTASDYSEKAREEDDEDARNAGVDMVREMQGGFPVTRDLESGRIEKEKSTKSSRPSRDPYLVSWDSSNDPENPKNWTIRRKWAATIVVSSFTFISPVSSSMVAPALPAIAKEFGIRNEVESQLILSIFVLAYAVGPLFLGPLSEIYGRVPVLQVANLFYLVFNLACGFAQNKGEMIAFRFLSGIGGSAPLACGGGVLSDCWRADERGRAISIYSLAPLLGPAIGPIAGSFITENTTWRWAFYATSIADAAVQVSGLFFLRETHPPTLLHRKANKIRQETGNSSYHTEFEHPERSFTSVLSRSLIRPFKMLATQPIVQVLACYMTLVYGIIYLVLSTFPILWTSPQYYHEQLGISGLNYISLGLGLFIGTQVCAPLNDKIYRRLRDRTPTKQGRPEFRVPLMIPASVCIPVGLFIYGWSAEAHTHWIVPNIGAAIFGLGGLVCFQSIQVYLVDAYVQFAASAIAAATVLRSLAGFGFPLFAPTMYDSLGFGWGNSVLAFIAIALGVPAPIMLWFFGERLRGRSGFAAGGD